jgi:EmrB/QacA subfamily drug resistance transporter
MPGGGRRISDRAVVVTAMLGGVLAPLNSTMIVVALPEILQGLGASLAWGTWIILSYLVAMAAVQPLGGSLGDRYGRRRLLLLGLAGFLLASVLAALAWSVEVLIVARTVQAITGATAIPNGTASVRTLVGPTNQGRAFGLIGAGIGVAAALGPPLGGVISESFGWRWIFAANLFVIVPALALAVRLPRAMGDRAAGRFDGSGAALLLTTLVTLALSATIWRVPGVPWGTAVALAGVAFAAAWVLRRHLARVRAPVLDLTLLARPGFLAAGLTVLFGNLTMYTIFLAMPVFLSRVVDWSTRDIGLLVAGMSVSMMVLGPIGGWLSDRVGRRAPAIAGSFVAALGCVPLLVIAADWSWPLYLLPLMVVGTGLGISSAPIHTAALEVARPGEAGQAAGLFSTMRYMGSIAGAAGMAAILGDAAGVGTFRLLFGGLVVAAAAAVWSSWRLPRRVQGVDGAARGSPLPGGAVEHGASGPHT